MSVSAELQRQVLLHAAGRCEYCRMHQALQGATFHVEHVVPVSKGGASDLENLALACPGCNLAKSDRIEGTDPESASVAPLFHPRRDVWNEHFEWNAELVVPLTAAGRVTAAILDLNHERRQRIRRAEAMFDLFPPDD